MKLDAKTIQILKNFSTINNSIVFRPGNTINIVSNQKNVMGIAQIDHTFDTEFGIGSIPKFLATVSLFKEPSIVIGEKKMTIKENNRKVDYVFTDTSLITTTPADKKITLDNPEIEFEITNDELSDAVKALSVLGLPELVVVGDGKNIYVKAMDVSNPTSDTYSVKIGDTDLTYRMVFKSEYLKLLPNDYKVSISKGGISKWAADDLEYWITTEITSKFGE